MIKSLFISLTSPHVCWLQTHFILLRFTIVLHRCCIFFRNWKQDPPSAKWFKIGFVTTLALLRGSGTEPAHLSDVPVLCPCYTGLFPILQTCQTCFHLRVSALAVSSAWVALLLSSCMTYYLTCRLSSNVTSVSQLWPLYLSKANLSYSAAFQGTEHLACTSVIYLWLCILSILFH